MDNVDVECALWGVMVLHTMTSAIFGMVPSLVATPLLAAFIFPIIIILIVFQVRRAYDDLHFWTRYYPISEIFSDV